MRFFLGGVPFGCDNIGDEAILESIVRIIRRNFKDPKITVSTDAQKETSALLGVDTVPLYGFRGIPLKGLSNALRKNDVFVWAGATGLSDYPSTALSILAAARKCGLKTVVWGVGMDSELNPAFFRLGGKKLALCKMMSAVFLNRIDFAKKLESVLAKRMRNKIAAELKKCDLVVVRDFQTLSELKKCSASLDAAVGADSAVILDKPEIPRLSRISEKVRDELLGGEKKIGICISAQRNVSDTDSLSAALDAILEGGGRKMFMIPMNPKTDLVAMREIRYGMKFKSSVFEVENCLEPEEVVTAASCCDVVISSRLHLLILSANVSTPIVGISRGSKVDNFLSAFGLESAGTVYDCNFALLKSQTDKFLENPLPFKAERDNAYAGFHKRLGNAEKLLVKTLSKTQ